MLDGINTITAVTDRSAATHLPQGEQRRRLATQASRLRRRLTFALLKFSHCPAERRLDQVEFLLTTADRLAEIELELADLPPGRAGGNPPADG